MNKIEIIKKLFDIANKPYPSDLYDERRTNNTNPFGQTNEGFNPEDSQAGADFLEKIFKA